MKRPTWSCMVLLSAASVLLGIAIPLQATAQPAPQKLLPADGTRFDRFGEQLALAGDTLVIGAPDDDSNFDEGSFVGAAYVFVRDASGFWMELQEILASDADIAGVDFGQEIATDGDTILIGDRWARSPALAGAVYVFTRDAGGTWIERQKLLASPAVAGGFFGESVAFQGDTALIGAAGEDRQPGSASLLGTGAVYVFTRDASGAWTERQKIRGSVRPGDPAYPAGFGRQVDLDGDTAIVGATAENGGSGAAYVLTRDATGTWTPGQRLAAGDGQPGDVFGFEVAVQDGTAMIGGRGSAYVFERDGAGVWSQTQKLTRAGSSALIRAIAMDGGTALIADGQGAYLLKRDGGGTWSEERELIPSEPAFGFGRAVALDGGTAAVGAPDDDDNGEMSGSAWVFLLPLTVDIDIRPGGLNPRARGVVPVVILGSDTLDVTEIDVRSLRLGPGGAVPAHVPRAHLADVNDDGHDDLIVHFWRGQIGLSCGDSLLMLTGETTSGQPIEGSDAVRTVGCRQHTDRSGVRRGINAMPKAAPPRPLGNN